jgi:hypothetical protein
VILSVEVIALDDLLLANFSIVGLLGYLLLGHPTLELLIIAQTVVLLRLFDSLENRL